MMKKYTVGSIVLSVCLLGSIGCKTNNVEKLAELGGTEEVDMVVTDEGALIVDTITIKASVTAKQPEKRKLTLQSDEGEVTIKVSPEMVNYDQIKVGDKVEAVICEEVAVFVGSGTPPSASGLDAVVLAPKGQKPGGIISETKQLTVAVVAVDSEKQNVTLKLPDGSTKTVKVGKDVDLSAVAIGETLTVVVTEGIAVSVTTP